MDHRILKIVIASSLSFMMLSLAVLASDKMEVPAPEKIDSTRMSNIMNLCIVLQIDNEACEKKIMKKCHAITNEQECTKTMATAIASRVHTKDSWE